MRRNKKGTSQIRHEVAHMAARLLVEDGDLSYHAARRKAAERLGYVGTRELPDNREIDAALRAYQRLFGTSAHAERLAELRRHAVSAMRLLAGFDPRLVGPVLTGTACEHARVTLHVFAGTVEDVTHFLLEHDIPFRLDERHYQSAEAVYPCLSFFAGDTEIELVVFPRDRRQPAPLSDIDGRPMPRADLREVQGLLEVEGQTPHDLAALQPPFL